MKTLKQKGHSKIIVLENVSTISLDINEFKDRTRIVFNFMNPIFLIGRWTPDYHYFEYDTAEEATKAFEKIISFSYIKQNFLISENPENKDIVNKKAITSISLKGEESKIIFNLNYPVTSYREIDKSPVEISKVIFWNYEFDCANAYVSDSSELRGLFDQDEI